MFLYKYALTLITNPVHGDNKPKRKETFLKVQISHTVQCNVQYIVTTSGRGGDASSTSWVFPLNFIIFFLLVSCFFFSYLSCIADICNNMHALILNKKGKIPELLLPLCRFVWCFARVQSVSDTFNPCLCYLIINKY